jgi:hypothetical protein
LPPKSTHFADASLQAAASDLPFEVVEKPAEATPVIATAEAGEKAGKSLFLVFLSVFLPVFCCVSPCFTT